MLVKLAHNARNEAHRHKHRRQNQGDGDNRGRDVLHGLGGRVAGRNILRIEVVLHGLNHHNGVVDHNADGQHEAEQRERINRESQRDKHDERADNGHRNGQNGDERGAPALQENEHHDGHQQQRLEQRFEYFLDGNLDHRNGLKNCLVDYVRREFLLQRVHGGVNAVGRLQGVTTGRLVDEQQGGGLAVGGVVA